MVNPAFNMRIANSLPTAVVGMRAWAENDCILSGQVRETMTALVIKMAQVVIIVTVATSMSLFGKDLHQWVTQDLRNNINQLVTGKDESPIKSIDENLLYTQVAMAAIDAVEVPATDAGNTGAKSRAELMSLFGIAGPPMTAGALLLMYEVAIALFVGFGPLFILCLLFDQTKALFHKWLMFGIGTLFSLAVLNVMVSLIMEMTGRVAAGLWFANGAISLLKPIIGDNDIEGFTNLAMQQGGVGLLMTVLLISVPPMAAAFFNATLGNFYTAAQVSGGKYPTNYNPGQPPGSYGYGGGSQSARPARPIESPSDPTADPVRAGGLKTAAHKDEVARPYSNQQG